MVNLTEHGLMEVKRRTNAHSPTLDTVIIVEETIRKLGACSITELYRALPRTVIYPTLELMIGYFYAKGFSMSERELFAHSV